MNTFRCSLPPLLLPVLNEKGDCRPNRRHRLRLRIGNFDVKFILERHDQLDGIKAVSPELLPSARGLDALQRELELRGGDFPHARGEAEKRDVRLIFGSLPSARKSRVRAFFSVMNFMEDYQTLRRWDIRRSKSA